MFILPLEAMSVPYYTALHVSTAALIIIMEAYVTTPSCLFFRGKMLLVSYSQNAFLQRRSVLQIATHIVCSYSLWKR